MSMPSVSIVVPTYLRTALLAEVVECFRRLTYDGSVELVIVNDSPLQTLRCAVPGVRCLNWQPVPLFGNLVNQAYRATDHNLIIRCDDDDLFMADMVTCLVDKLAHCDAMIGSPAPVARNRRLMLWDGEQLARRSASNHHGAIVRKDAWTAAGGLPALPADQADLAFWRKITPQWFVGRWHHEDDGHFHTIYRNDPNRVHLEPPHAPPLTAKQFRAAQEARVHAGQEPRGPVDIVPLWSRDWKQIVDDFTAGGKVSYE